MIDIKSRKEGNEDLDLPIDTCLDTPVYRDAYRDLIKSRGTRFVTYDQFLYRMKQRNIESRRKEFDRRRIIIDEKREPLVYKAIKEMATAK